MNKLSLKTKTNNFRFMVNTETKKVKRLAIQCLRYKWIKEQHLNLNRILTPCAFCIEDGKLNNKCFNCRIPIILCSNGGTKGFIGFLFSQYKNCFLRDIKSDYYILLRESLICISNIGKTSVELESKLISFTKR